MTDITTPQRNSAERGVMAALLAYGLWGFLPIYFILVRGTAPEEVLMHRILWSVPVGVVIDRKSVV